MKAKIKKIVGAFIHGQSDASRISPEWNNWLRFISNSALNDNEKMLIGKKSSVEIKQVFKMPTNQKMLSNVGQKKVWRAMNMTTKHGNQSE